MTNEIKKKDKQKIKIARKYYVLKIANEIKRNENTNIRRKKKQTQTGVGVFGDH